MAPRNKEGKNRKNSLNDMITRKLAVFFLVVLLAFIMLIARLFNISFQDGEKYKKQVLSQQKYDNKTIHYKRGSIVDRNGTVLAYSAQVYNVILDTKRLNSDPESIEPTLVALNQCFNIDPSELVFAGDEKKDIECAHNAGTKGILINRTDEDKEFGQDHTINDLSGLLSLL